jgi:fibronectin type 3 domain-containing protein
MKGFVRFPWARKLGAILLLAIGAFPGDSWGLGLSGYWPLNESSGTTTVDASGSGNTGTLVNSPTWGVGQIGNALTFTGTTQVGVNGAGNLANLYTGGLTVMAWIKPTGTGGGGKGRIVDKNNNDAGWFFAMNSATTVNFTAGQFVTTAAFRASSGSIVLNTWKHVAASWAGTTAGAGINLYINGVLSNAAAAPTDGVGAAMSDLAVPLTIGNRPVDNARGFAGGIDDVRVYNRVLSATEITAIAGDAVVPTAPTANTATANSSSQITVSWSGATDNVGVTGYFVERCSGAGCSNFVQVASPTTSPYVNTGLAASTSYSYRVRATDAAGLLSSYSATASATTQAGGGGDTTPPTAPSGLGATVASSSQINLSWTASTDNIGVTTYLVERCQGAGCSAFTQVGTVTGTPPLTTFQSTGLAASTSYSFRVRAQDAALNFSTTYSNTATATTQSSADTTPPSTPTNFTATAGTNQVSLAWTASTDNVAVTGYVIERCQGPGCTNFSQVATVTSTSYVDAFVSVAFTYNYRVRAVDAAGNSSGYSGTSGAVPLECT